MRLIQLQPQLPIEQTEKMWSVAEDKIDENQRKGTKEVGVGRGSDTNSAFAHLVFLVCNSPTPGRITGFTPVNLIIPIVLFARRIAAL